MLLSDGLRSDGMAIELLCYYISIYLTLLEKEIIERTFRRVAYWNFNN